MKDTINFNITDIEKINGYKSAIDSLEELKQETKNLTFPEEIDPAEYVCLLIDNKINRIRKEMQNKLEELSNV